MKPYCLGIANYKRNTSSGGINWLKDSLPPLCITDREKLEEHSQCIYVRVLCVCWVGVLC